MEKCRLTYFKFVVLILTVNECFKQNIYDERLAINIVMVATLNSVLHAIVEFSLLECAASWRGMEILKLVKLELFRMILGMLFAIFC